MNDNEGMDRNGQLGEVGVPLIEAAIDILNRAMDASFKPEADMRGLLVFVSADDDVPVLVTTTCERTEKPELIRWLRTAADRLEAGIE